MNLLKSRRINKSTYPIIAAKIPTKSESSEIFQNVSTDTNLIDIDAEYVKEEHVNPDMNINQIKNQAFDALGSYDLPAKLSKFYHDKKSNQTSNRFSSNIKIKRALQRMKRKGEEVSEKEQLKSKVSCLVGGRPSFSYFHSYYGRELPVYTIQSTIRVFDLAYAVQRENLAKLDVNKKCT